LCSENKSHFLESTISERSEQEEQAQIAVDAISDEQQMPDAQAQILKSEERMTTVLSAEAQAIRGQEQAQEQ
jgi:hypothetical protein